MNQKAEKIVGHPNCRLFLVALKNEEIVHVTNVVSYLTLVQQDNANCELSCKTLCVHHPSHLRALTDFELLKIFISEKQLSLYSSNVEVLLQKIDYFDTNLKSLGCDELRKTLNVKCVRSFVVTICLYCVYVTDTSEIWSDLFVQTEPNESDMTARLTTLRSNLSDIEYVGNNANRLMKMIRACLLEGCVVLYCTGTKSAESSSCSCGVKASFKPKKIYTQIYNQAKKTVNASVVMVTLK